MTFGEIIRRALAPVTLTPTREVYLVGRLLHLGAGDSLIYDKGTTLDIVNASPGVDGLALLSVKVHAGGARVLKIEAGVIDIRQFQKAPLDLVGRAG